MSEAYGDDIERQQPQEHSMNFRFPSWRGVASRCAVVAGFVLAAHAATAAAAEYPQRPVTVVVPYSAGGFAGMLGQMVGERMAADLGQPVVMDYRAGANGNIAARYAASAPADGYTVLLGTSSGLAINPSLYGQLPFDTVKDFKPVAQLITASNVVVVSAQSDIGSIADLVAKAKAAPDTVTFGSSGIGSSMHLSGEMFKTKTGTKMLHVPYKGSAPALTDLMGGQITAMFSDTTALPHVKAGKLKALAVTSERRMASMPEVPTVEQAGVAGFKVESWYGLFVPAGTPDAIVARLNKAAIAAMNDPGVRARLLDLGSPPSADMRPAYLASVLQSDLKEWAIVVRQSGAKAE
jgi:tripartite-type tricarboxylate transporter receptor subunit TctC